MRESGIQSKLIKYLEALGGWVLNVKGGPETKSGTSDLVLCMRGQFWAVEVKKPGEKPTPIQVRRLTQVSRSGGRVFLWESIEDAYREAEEVMMGRASRLHGPGTLKYILQKLT